MKELEMKEKSSKSLLANVLDMDDDFRWAKIYYYYSLNDRCPLLKSHLTYFIYNILLPLLQSDNF